MKKTFLCFESEAALFLLPLELIVHIVSGDTDGQGVIIYQGCEVNSYDPAVCFGKGKRQRTYAVLVKAHGYTAGLLTDKAVGVFEAAESDCFPLPPEVIGEKNQFLKQAVYLDGLNSWAFLMDIEVFLDHWN